MKHHRGSLITEPNILKLPKLNNTVKTQEEQPQPCPKKDQFYIRPQLKKILYSPFEFDARPKQQKRRMIAESCLIDKTYDDIKEHALETKIQQYLSANKSMNLDKLQPIPARNRSLVGKEAPFLFYNDYKKLGKLVQKAQSNKENQGESLLLPMLQKTEKMGILPMMMGLVKFQGDSNILNANNYNLGDKYIIAMSSGLRKAKMIEKCFLSSNRITNKGFQELANCLNHEVNTLDVSFNAITQISDKMMELIGHPEGRLEKLNLQNNQIKKKETIYSLVESVSISKHLKALNLRSNGITNDCTDHLCDLIEAETHLQELYLGKNFLTSRSAMRIFTNLTKNKSIKVFDYSLNNLGEDENNQCAKVIAQCLTKNKTLLHVDLSSNNFTQQGSKIISEGLQPNKRIYGFHFDGNHGYVDSRGFLIIAEKQLTSLHSLLETKIDSFNVTAKRSNSTSTPKLFKNVCWICEGWYEQEFRFSVPEDYKEEKKLVYIHFDFELFAPRLINIQDKQIKYKTMVPPTKYCYFFTFDGKQFTDKIVKNVLYELPQTFTYEMDHKPVTFEVKQVSCKSKSTPKKIVDDWHEVIISTLPRSTGLVAKKVKEKWTYEKSLWAKEWKLDTDQLLKKCFEKDWKCSKIMNLVKNQQDQDKVKQKLFQNYKAIKLAYKYFSSWSPFGDVWAVSNNAWTQFCQQAKIISKDTPLKITDLTFITTNSISGADYKSNTLVPERGLVRFQFMECLVRLSEEKYKKLGVTDNFSDSIDMMLKDCVLPLAKTLHQEIWRMEKYFIEQNDALIKKYRPIFTFMYKKNSKLNVKPGDKPFMCLTEFRTILQRANLAGTMLLERDIFVSFNFSMMTQVDELQNQRFIRMSEIEFIEAVARCSSILPKTCSLAKDKTREEGYLKFEWLINELKNTNCNEDIKAQFPEEGSIFDKNQDDQ